MRTKTQSVLATYRQLATRTNIAWFALACAITALLTVSNVDAQYFVAVQGTWIYSVFRYAGMLGFVAPLLIIMGLLTLGTYLHNKRITRSAWLFVQATFFGWFGSTLLKVFTGRMPPPYGGTIDTAADYIIQLSHGFRFGFYEGGIFWGWPSSHTATAFAGAVALAVYYREKPWVRYLAICYASYIAIGASMSFHWLGDVVAGVIVGSIIGVAVANSFVKPTTSGNSVDA